MPQRSVHDMLLLMRRESRATLALACPVIIGQLGQILMSVVDSLMIGRLGAAPLAAAAAAGGLFMLLMMTGFGVSIAITPLTAMARSSGRSAECGQILRHGLWFNFAVALLLFVPTLFGRAIFAWLNQPAEIIAPAAAYLDILGWSLFPVMLFQSHRQFIEGLSIMRPAMVITLLANLVNVLVNWVLIFGHLGFPALGLSGAGWATLFSRLLMALLMGYYLRASPLVRPYRATDTRFDPRLIHALFKIGLPIGVQYFFEVSAFAGASFIAGWLGTDALAAHQIALNLASVTYMFAVGVAAAATVRVATAAGQGDTTAVRRAGFSAIALGALIMGGFALLFILLRHKLPALYIADPAVIRSAAALLVIAALFQLSDGTQTVGLGALRGLSDVKIPTLITFLAYWAFGLPVGYALAFGCRLGVSGIWLGLFTGLSVTAFLVTHRFQKVSALKI